MGRLALAPLEDGVAFFSRGEVPDHVLAGCDRLGARGMARQYRQTQPAVLVAEMLGGRPRSCALLAVQSLGRWVDGEECQLVAAHGPLAGALIAVFAQRAFDQEVAHHRTAGTPYEALRAALAGGRVTAAHGLCDDPGALERVGFKAGAGGLAFELADGVEARRASATSGRRKYDVVRQHVDAEEARRFEETRAFGPRVAVAPGQWRVARDRRTGRVVGYVGPSKTAARSTSPDARAALQSESDSDSDDEMESYLDDDEPVADGLEEHVLGDDAEPSALVAVDEAQRVRHARARDDTSLLALLLEMRGPLSVAAPRKKPGVWRSAGFKPDDGAPHVWCRDSEVLE